jgi:hypothetical protein
MTKHIETHWSPRLYSICEMKLFVLILIESGHIIYIYEPKKLTFVLTVSIAKIPWWYSIRFHSNISLTVATDSTFLML